MSDESQKIFDRRLLLLTSTGRDATAVAKVMMTAGIDWLRCHTMDELCSKLGEGAAAVLLPEDALLPNGSGQLARALLGQPVWSDMPVILLSSNGAESPMLTAMIAELGNVTIIERPVRVSTLVSVVRAALRARDRQYQLREHLRQQARTQAMLVESADHYRNAADLNPQFPWTADVSGQAVEYSTRWLELTGQQRKDALGEGWMNAIREDEREIVRAAWRESVKIGEPLDVEYHVRLASGMHRWMRTRSAPRRNADGAILRWYCTNEDIHARRVAEETLRSNAERLRLALAAARLGGWEWTPSADHLVLSERSAEILGLSEAGNLPRAKLREMLHPDDVNAIGEAYLAAVESQGDFDVEYRAIRGDGEVVWFAAKGRGTYDSRGKLVHMVGVLSDITPRKTQEMQRQQLLDAERAARTDAEHANRLKDEFLSIVSHELRTPLNAILGWSQILRAAPDDAEEVVEGLEVIERNARSQTQLIEDLLDMSRIIGGKVRLEVKPVILPVVIESAVASMRPAAEARGVALSTEVEDTACPVVGDADRLQQVVWNLLSNAIKFSPRGGKVAVALQSRRNYCEISVSDTGLGIKAEFLPFVFDRFRQAEGSTTRRHGGLGLGLSIVKQLVELHGGDVRVESAGENQGSTFRVRLPVAGEVFAATIQPPVTPTIEVVRSVERAIATPSLAGVTVLVVDDEPDARSLAKRLLEDAGADVNTAENADDAELQLNEKQFDVLLSDIGMPGRDGYELAHVLRALDAARGTKTAAIALTAFARKEDRQRAIDAGFNDHIAKPVDAALLISMVGRFAGLGGAV